MIRKLGLGLLYLVIAVLLLLSVLPFVLMVITAIQETTTLRFTIDADQLTLGNFVKLFTLHDFGSALLTSVIVVAIAVVLNNIVCSLAAFAFAFKPFPGSSAVFSLYLATMMVPAQVTMIPMFIMFREMGILGGHLSLALPVVNAFGVFLMRQFMTSIPPSLLEAARIDGATDLRIFWSIIVPAIKPVLVALTVFTFLTTWNDFLWPLVSQQSGENTTLTLAVSQLKGSFQTQYGMVMAGTTIAFLVPFLVYVILQRQFVEGVTASGMKG
ncbi:MAG: carbohydrate ABC transporter permease [Tessaracoccus sp.]